MLSDREKTRYARQISLQDFGIEGQEKLKDSKVLIVGLGGLGSIEGLYLAAAGAGTIGLIDGDRISLSNLQRQILYREAQEGMPKASTAKENLMQLNSNCRFQTYDFFLNRDNAEDIIRNYDMVMDASDNFATRYLINDACFKLRKAFVYCSLSDMTAQICLFDFKVSDRSYRDLFPEDMHREDETFQNNAVIGVLPAIAGSICVNEAIKHITGMGNTLLNRLLTFDLSTNDFAVFDL